MKKFLAFLLGLTIAMTSMTFSVLPASAEGLEILDENIIYIEDFENYVPDKEWLPAISGKASATTKGKVATGDQGFVKDGEDPVVTGTWGYSISKYYNKEGSGASVKPVVLSGHEDRGQVLAITNPLFNDEMSSKATDYWINIRRNVGVESDGTVKGIARGAMKEDKKIVLEVKYYVPTGSYLSEASFMSGVPSANTVAATNGFETVYSTMLVSGGKPSFYSQSSGKNGYIQARKKGTSEADKWHTMRIIVDTSKEPSVYHSDTTRTLVDEKYVYTAYFDAASGATGYKAAEVPESGLPDKWYVTDHPAYPMIDRKQPNPVKQIDFLGTTSDSTSDEYIIQSAGFISKMDHFYGTHFSAKSRTEGKGKAASTYYIDDLKAYYIDALDFEVKNASDYSGGEVKLTFNQPLKEAFYEYISYIPSGSGEEEGDRELKKLFTMVDKDGNVVDGGIEEFKLSADKKVVSITPATTLTKGEDYKIVINPLLIDVYGQGLNKNGHNNPTYVDLHISKDFVPFAVESQSRKVFEGFMQGRNAEITVNFTKAILNDAAITEGIVVTKEDGTVVARDNGWTAELSANKKTITFDFTNLPTADYIITANDKLTDENEATLEGEFEIKLEKANDVIWFFNETFEDDKYTVDKNWINAENKVATSYSKLTEFSVNDGDWTIQRHWNDGVPATETFKDTDDFVGVVAVPEKASNKMSGNVLKVYNNRGTDVSYNYVAFRRNFNQLNGIDFSKEPYKGKKLVIEADVYTTSTASTTPLLSISPKKSTLRDFYDWKSFFSDSGTYTMAGAWQSPFNSYGPMAMHAQAKGKEKITANAVNYKFVVSKTENIDTLSAYENGKLIQRSESAQSVLKGHPFNKSARHEFVPSDYTDDKPIGETIKVADLLYGIWGQASKSSSDKPATEIFIDNFKAYMVDEFKVVEITGNSEVFNAKTGTVDYTFTKPVALSSTTEGVVLVDENGKVVENGIKSVELTDAGFKMAVSLNEKEVSGLKNYSVKLTEGLRDVDGLVLSTEWKYETYPIDQYYQKNGTIDVTTNKVTTTYDAYSITDISNTATLNCAYIPATDGKPAHLVYKNSSGSFFRIAADMYVRDDEAMQLYAPLTTTKSTSVYAMADEAVVSGNNVTTKVTITNPEAETKSIWCIVAAYGQFDQMLGYQLIDCKELAGNTQVKDALVSFTADTSKGDVKYVRMFLWNSDKDMASYQPAENLIK